MKNKPKTWEDISDILQFTNHESLAVHKNKGLQDQYSGLTNKHRDPLEMGSYTEGSP